MIREAFSGSDEMMCDLCAQKSDKLSSVGDPPPAGGRKWGEALVYHGVGPESVDGVRRRSLRGVLWYNLMKWLV